MSKIYQKMPGLWLISLDVVASKWPRIASAEGLKARGFGLQRSPRWHTLRSPGHVVFVDMSGLPVLRKKSWHLKANIEKIVGLPFVLEKSRPNWSDILFFGSKSTHQDCSWIKRSTATMANRCCWVSSMDHPWVNKSFRFQKYVMLFQLLLLCTSNYIWSFKKKHPLKSYTPEA